MNTTLVMVFENLGRRVGLWRVDQEGCDFWVVTNGTTSKSLSCLSFEHAKEIFDRCAEDIRVVLN